MLTIKLLLDLRLNLEGYKLLTETERFLLASNELKDCFEMILSLPLLDLTVQ